MASRVHRKRRRLSPDLLVENTSSRGPTPKQKSVSRRFRSRLAAIRKLEKSEAEKRPDCARAAPARRCLTTCQFCRGSTLTDLRVLLSSLTVPFDHRLSDHKQRTVGRRGTVRCDCGLMTQYREYEKMRQTHHIHPADVMSRDALIEIVLMVGAVIFVGLLFALVRILYTLPSSLIRCMPSCLTGLT